MTTRERSDGRARQAAAPDGPAEGRPRDDGSGATRKTVLVALSANGAIAVVKLAGGLLSGSTALLAEAAHSVADTANQGFLLVSIGLSERPANPSRPFGYGQERFLWTFVAAIGMFLAGSVFALGYGAYRLIAGASSEGGYAIALGTLAISFVAEGISWLRALRQTRGEAHEARQPLLEYVRQSRDPSVKMVLFEDTAALAGVVLATVGVVLDKVTGASVFDPAASVAIGVLLIVVAAGMARDSQRFLVGAAARPAERRRIEEVIESRDEVECVVELLTMVLGPSQLLVAARLDLADGLDSAQVEEVSSAIDRALRDAVPDVSQVFLDATPARSRC